MTDARMNDSTTLFRMNPINMRTTEKSRRRRRRLRNHAILLLGCGGHEEFRGTTRSSCVFKMLLTIRNLTCTLTIWLLRFGDLRYLFGGSLLLAVGISHILGNEEEEEESVDNRKNK